MHLSAGLANALLSEPDCCYTVRVLLFPFAAFHVLFSSLPLPQNCAQGAFCCLAPGRGTAASSALTVSWPVMNVFRLALRVAIVCQSASHFAATVSPGAGDGARCACGDVSVERGGVGTGRGAIGGAG